jgi:hypothetical protein
MANLCLQMALCYTSDNLCTGVRYSCSALPLYDRVVWSGQFMSDCLVLTSNCHQHNIVEYVLHCFTIPEQSCMIRQIKTNTTQDVQAF